MRLATVGLGNRVSDHVMGSVESVNTKTEVKRQLNIECIEQHVIF